MLFNTKTNNNEIASFERLHADQLERADKVFNKLLKTYCMPFFTFGNLDAIVLLYKLLTVFPLKSARVVITTYGLTQKYVNQIALFKRAGLISHVTLVTSTNLKTLQPKLVGHINQVFDELVLCEIHAKIITVTDNNTNITVISSMNLTRNNKIEAGFISSLPQHYIDTEAFILSTYEFNRGTTRTN